MDVKFRMKKNGYTSIIIYTVVILGIMYMQNRGILSYTMMEIFLAIALAIFILFNFRGTLKKMFTKK
jgi:hypothetical protein